MARRSTAVLIVAALGLVLAAAASAGKPERLTFSFDDPAYEAGIAAELSAACGFAVTVDMKGKVEIVVLDKRTEAGVVEINAYSSRALFTNASTGRSVSLVDAGPDLVRFDGRTGELQLAVTGRALTGSGVVGRVVFDLDTGEVVFEAGLEHGDWIENACAALA
jgi:hypothetical protein